MVGVDPFASAMFIFYYAVLSEVSPPTALAPFAAAALTGGKPVRTMWLTWKYTLPAFLVPFIFVLSPRGVGLLLEGGAQTVLIAFTTSVLAVAALAVVTGAWLFGHVGVIERLLFLIAAIALLVMTPTFITVGISFAAVGLIVRLMNRRRDRAKSAADLESGVDAGPDPAASEPATLTASTPAERSRTQW